MEKIIKKIILFFVVSCIYVCYLQANNFYASGPQNIKKISLTFDDGPGENTLKILEILKKKKVKATFFMLGCNVKNNSETIKKVFNDGHEIANHTYKHINFYNYNKENKTTVIENEILSTEKAIKDILNIKTFLIRFPYGYSKQDAIKIAKKYNYYVINWTFGIDWKQMDINKIYDEYKRSIKNGSIFLMHDVSKNNNVLMFLEKLIDEIIENGYKIVTISELLNLKNI
jgi:peptidoglycan/xylan/chitin deacetylase (PgdA/CDA1 family)